MVLVLKLETNDYINIYSSKFRDKASNEKKAINKQLEAKTNINTQLFRDQFLQISISNWQLIAYIASIVIRGQKISS